MSRVILADKHLLIDGEKRYIRSGEIHYFRISREKWADRLDKAKEGGLNCIASYIPWFWHEPEEGRFDFTGETVPERDLVGYLELIKERKLYFFARPGPFINSEIRYGGHPQWLFEKYPEVYSKRADGSSSFWVGVGVPAPSQLQPKFLEFVNRWYDKVVTILARYSIDNGGPIILSQPDNEMNLVFTYGLDGSLYDFHIIGEKGKKGIWQDWLLKTYGSLEELNRRYGTSYSDISQIQPPREKLADLPGRRLMLDWLRFKQWHIFYYAKLLAKRMYDLGLKVPYSLNEPVNLLWGGPGDHASCAKFMEEEKENCFTTGHTYLYGAEQDIFGLPVTIYRVEMIKTSRLKGPVFSSEVGAGWWDLSRNRATYNWDLLLKTQLGHGLNGYNLYVYAGGYTPERMGRGGKDYDFQAPIRADGRREDAYEKTSDLSRFINGWEREILDSRKDYDATLALFPELPLMAKFCEKPEEIGLVSDDIVGMSVLRQGEYGDIYSTIVETLTVLTALNINVEIINFIYPSKSPGRECKLLIVPNPGAICKEGFKFILDHLNEGGKVFFYPTVPSQDVDGYPQKDLINLLKTRVLKVIPTGGRRAGDIRHRSVDGTRMKDVAVDKRIYLYQLPEGAEVLATYEGEVCAYKQEALRGEVVVCGFIPHYITEESQELFKDLFIHSLGLERVCYSQDGKLNIVQRRNEAFEPHLLLVTASNSLGAKSRTKIVANTLKERIVFPILSDLEIYPKSIRNLWVNLSLKGNLMKYCTSELFPLDTNRTKFFLKGDIGTTGEIAFTKPIDIWIDERKVELRQLEGLWIGTYEHKKEPLKLEIVAI